MMGRGPQIFKPDQNVPNNDQYSNSGEAKYPLFEAEPLSPNRHQNSWYRSTKYIIRLKLDNRCLHTSGFAAETPSGESSLVRCSFGLAGPAHFLLALAGEEGVFKDTLEQSVEGSTPRTLLVARTQHQRTLLWTWQLLLWVPHFSEATGSLC